MGKEVLKQIERVSKKPILAVINTHKHGDHWFANKAVIQKYPKAVIYAQPNMIKAAKAGEAENWYKILDKITHNLKGTKEFAYPAKELKGGDKIVIDGEEFEIFHPKDAHTDGDILVLHKNSNTLFLGDNVMRGRLGAFDESSSIIGNYELLSNLMKNSNHKLYVPGHGKSGNKEAVVGLYHKYLKTLVEEGKKAYEDDKETYEV